MGQEFEFESLPFPLGPPEQTEEWYAAITSRQYSVDVDAVLDELQELIQTWRDACAAERRGLSKPRESHPLPLEYSAGLAQGLENAAKDLERLIDQAIVKPAA